MNARFVLSSGLCALLAGNGLARAEAVPGQKAPAFTAKDIRGQTHTLSDYRGKMVVLEAYNLDCPFCARHYQTGALPEVQQWAADKGVIWLVVNSVHAAHPSYRKPAAAQKEFAAQKIKAAAWLDDSSGAVGKAYGLKTTPHLVVVDAQGVVAYNGAFDDKPDGAGDPRRARNYARETIEKLLAGELVAVKTTKPYGCSVKYAN